MTEHNQKLKNNIFLNSKLKSSNNQTNNNNKQDNSLRSNPFSSEIGKNTMREIQEKKKDLDVNNEELFPSLLNNYDLFLISKTNRKNKANIISYKDIAKNKETSIKIETDEIEPGWVNLFRDENNKIIKMQGKTTPECLELERKEQELRMKREINETENFLRELEYERNLRKELFGDIQEFYDPNKDPFYTKEKNIVIYTLSDLSDSDTEGSNYDNQENDYLNDDNYL